VSGAAPGFEEPDEIEHLTVCPGREVVQLVDDLLFYLAHGNFTSAVYDPLALQSLPEEELFTGAIVPRHWEKLSGGKSPPHASAGTASAQVSTASRIASSW